MTKRILNEETRKQLLGYVPFSVDAKITYTPEEFLSIKDETLRPVFELRSLNQAEITQLKKNSQELSTPNSNRGKIAKDNVGLIRACVLGWVNLFDAGSGEEIDYEASPTGGCKDEIFDRLPLWVVVSLMEFIKKITGLSSAEDLSLK